MYRDSLLRLLESIGIGILFFVVVGVLVSIVRAVVKRLKT